jgi:hypothetical protein
VPLEAGNKRRYRRTRSGHSQELGGTWNLKQVKVSDSVPDWNSRFMRWRKVSCTAGHPTGALKPCPRQRYQLQAAVPVEPVETGQMPYTIQLPAIVTV